MKYSAKYWSIGEVVNVIHALSRECSSPVTDPIEAFEVKKDLHQLKFIIESVLIDLPTFPHEREWLDSQEKKRLINHLKRKK